MHLVRQRALEARLRVIHQSAADQAGRTVTRIGIATPRQLERAQDAMDAIARRLSQRTTAMVSQHLSREVSQGVMSAQAQAKHVTIPRAGKRRLAGRPLQRVLAAARGFLRSGADGLALRRRIFSANMGVVTRLNQFLGVSQATQTSAAKIVPDVRGFFRKARRSPRQERVARLVVGPRGSMRSASEATTRASRTESNRAFRMGVNRYAQAKGWVSAVKWSLAPGHGGSDICDELATTDAHGLGRGVYPPDSIPDVPHMRCLCYTSIVTVRAGA